MSKAEGIYEAKIIASEKIKGFDKRRTYRVAVTRNAFKGYSIVPVEGNVVTDKSRKIDYPTIFALTREWDLIGDAPLVYKKVTK